uniref:Ig-like domain-containing protein n=1 Tax=Cyprinus carpio TaxID=7962 RepID=A0A8C1S620_CYPCA
YLNICSSLLLSALCSDYSEFFSLCLKTPKPSVTIKPAQHVFRGERVTLRCDINAEGVTSWQYGWYKDSSVNAFSDKQEYTFSSVTESDAGKYFCDGSERGGSRTSHRSDKVTLTVSGEFDHLFTYTHKFNMLLMSWT